MIRSLEMFCGAGGLALGLHQAGFEPVALLEWDKDSCENIKANIANGFEGVANWDVVQTDVRLARYADYGASARFVTGGPPCQPFSLGGKHKANADARDMFPEAVRAVRELRPQGFIFENVRGLLRKSFSSYFNYILLQLSHPEIVANSDMDWAAQNLDLADFHCRFIVVDDIWIPLAESMLIERFKPVWNCVLDGFGNHDPGKGRRQGMTPQWDCLHPGRVWASRLQPGANTPQELAERAEKYLAAITA